MTLFPGSARLNEQVFEVVIVLDSRLGERLRTLTAPRELWVLASPLNEPVCATLRQEGFKPGLTLFHSEGEESAADACLRIAGEVDEHHGESAPEGPWTALRVIGTPLSAELEARFRELGAGAFVPSEAGFTCTRGLPTSPEGLITALAGTLAARGFPVASVPPSARTPEEAARALFSLAAQAGAGTFNVWSEEQDETRDAAVSVFFSMPEASAPASGMLGRERQVVRQHFDPSLYVPLSAALAAVSQRGARPSRPDRGEVPFPPDAADPGLRFRVEFQDTARGPQVMAIARTRETRALFPDISELPLSPPEAAYLAERLWELDTLFGGRPIVFTGAADAGRETSFLAALDAFPGNTHALAMVERARTYDPRLGAILIGPELSLVQGIRAALRQDPDLVFAEAVRTDAELEMIINAGLTGHGALYGMEEAPEAALLRMDTVVPLLPHSPLLVHHTRDAASGARSAALYVRDPESPLGAPRVLPWSPAG